MTTLNLSERQEEALYSHLIETEQDAPMHVQRELSGILDQLPEQDILTRVPDDLPEDHRREVVCVGCGDSLVAYAPEIRACSDCRDESPSDESDNLPLFPAEKADESSES